MADKAASQSITAQVTPQVTPQPSIFSGNDPKRMSFDGTLPGFGLSQSPGSLTSGLLGGMGAPNFQRDRKDSLKGLVHLDDFGTPTE